MYCLNLFHRFSVNDFPRYVKLLHLVSRLRAVRQHILSPYSKHPPLVLKRALDDIELAVSVLIRN